MQRCRQCNENSLLTTSREAPKSLHLTAYAGFSPSVDDQDLLMGLESHRRVFMESCQEDVFAGPAGSKRAGTHRPAGKVLKMWSPWVAVCTVANPSLGGGRLSKSYTALEAQKSQGSFVQGVSYFDPRRECQAVGRGRDESFPQCCVCWGLAQRGMTNAGVLTWGCGCPGPTARGSDLRARTLLPARQHPQPASGSKAGGSKRNYKPTTLTASRGCSVLEKHSGSHPRPPCYPSSGFAHPTLYRSAPAAEGNLDAHRCSEVCCFGTRPWQNTLLTEGRLVPELCGVCSSWLGSWALAVLWSKED